MSPELKSFADQIASMRTRKMRRSREQLQRDSETIARVMMNPHVALSPNIYIEALMDICFEALTQLEALEHAVMRGDRGNA